MRVAFLALVSLAPTIAEAQSDAAIAKAVADLSGKDLARRRAAADALIAHGRRAVPALRRVLAVAPLDEVGGSFGGRGVWRGLEDPLTRFRLWGTVLEGNPRPELAQWRWYGVLQVSADIAADDRVRKLAIYILGRIGADANAVIPELLAELRSDSTASDQAAWALSRIGAPAVPKLLPRIDRSIVQLALAEVPGAVDAMVTFAEQTDDVEKRIGVIRALAHRGREADPRAIRYLFEQTTHGSKKLANHAMRALGRYGKAARPMLEKATVAASVTTRARALATLCRAMPSAASLRTAIACLDDERESIRRYAAEAVGHCAKSLQDAPRKLARDALVEAYDEESIRMRIAVMLGLAAVRDENVHAPDFVPREIADASLAARVAAIDCLSRADARAFTGKLVDTIVLTRYVSERVAACRALRRFELSGARARRAAATLTAQWPKRAAADGLAEIFDLLATFGEDAAPALPHLIRALSRRRHRSPFRAQGNPTLAAMRAIATMGRAAQPAAAKLLPWLDRERYRTAAATALGAIGSGGDGLDRLLPKLESETNREQRNAIVAIQLLRLTGSHAERAAAKLDVLWPDVDAPTKVAIVGAWGSMTDTRALLEKAHRDPAKEVRAAATRMLERQLGRK